MRIIRGALKACLGGVRGRSRHVVDIGAKAKLFDDLAATSGTSAGRLVGRGPCLTAWTLKVP